MVKTTVALKLSNVCVANKELIATEKEARVGEEAFEQFTATHGAMLESEI